MRLDQKEFHVMYGIMIIAGVILIGGLRFPDYSSKVMLFVGFFLLMLGLINILRGTRFNRR